MWEWWVDDPTAEMIEAGLIASHVEPGYIGPDDVRRIWEAMRDCALLGHDCAVSNKL